MNSLTPVENTLLGVVSGTEVLLIVQPMIFWKNAAQQGLGFTLNPRTVYRGLGASAASQAFITGTQFFSTGYVKRALTGGENRRLTNLETIGAALVGGSISGVVCGPLELIMIQQQRNGGSFGAAASKLIGGQRGVLSLTRGLLPSIVREGAYCCGYLGIAPAMSRFFEEMLTGEQAEGESSGGAKARVLGALAGGIFAGVVSHPFDTIKTRMQGDPEAKLFRSMAEVVKDTGSRGMFRGVMWRSTIIVTATLLINIFKDASAPLMFPWKFSSGKA